MYSLPFFFISLSLSASFPGSSSLAPFSSALSPFRPFSLFLVRSVLRNTHATSTLERARALHPLHRDVLSKIQPFFSRADQWALPLPLYPASAYIRRPFRHSRPGFEISFVSLYVSSIYANNLFGYHFRYTRADVPLERENLVLSASSSAVLSLGFLAAVALILLRV